MTIRNVRQFLAGGFAAMLVSQGAFALEPDVDTIDLEVRTSGATATENALVELLRNELCESDVDSFDGTNQKAVACAMDATTVPGLSGTLNVLVRKSSVGGSGNGVGPVCNGTSVAFLTIDTVQDLEGGVPDPSNASCYDDGLTPAARGATALPPVATLGLSDATAGDGRWACNATPTFNGVPLAGLSDVKPTEVFQNASANCGTNVFPSFETVFGIPVSLKLYVALQTAQGLIAGSCAAGDMEDECMPSLATQTVAGLISGQIKTWDQLLVDGLPLEDFAGVTDPSSNLVTYCRRSNTSGTFASNEIRMLQRNCLAGARNSPNPPGDPINGPIIPGTQSGSDNMEQCLHQLNEDGTYLNGATLFTGSDWAIGHNSLDRNPETAVVGQTDWRFIKLDGVAPTFVNVANGSYRFSVSSTIQWADGTPATAPTGDQLLILEELRDSGADPASLGAGLVAHDFGDSGLMALAEFGNTITYTGGVYDTSVPVTPWTHVVGGVFSNCNEGGVPAAPNNEPIPLD